MKVMRLLSMLWLLAALACGAPETAPRGNGDPAPGDLGADDMVGSDPWVGDAAGDALGSDPWVGDAAGDTMVGDAPPPGDEAPGDNLSGGDHIGTACSANPQTVVVLVTVAELHAALGAGTTLAVVDVREPAETANGIIAGALLYPWNSGVLQANHANLPSDRPLYVICASGGRSGQAALFLISNGHTCVHSVSGGMNAWTTAGYATVPP